MSSEKQGIILRALKGIKDVKLKYKIMLLIAGYSAYINARNNGWLPKKSLKDDHVFITGAGSGIGRLMAIKLAD